MLFNVKINTINFLINSNLSILEACALVGINIPRFCYHETLPIAGNCRMCLVEIEKSPKPVAACAVSISNNLIVYTNTPLILKARENILEVLLLNHPLDCPICDQAGDCDLQDQTKTFGSGYSRFFNKKRVVDDKKINSFIKTIMTRCIHCTRCIRFSDDVTGVSTLGTFNRGTMTEIGSYSNSVFSSELSGNIIDLCPVGALTSQIYAFKSRPWELRVQETFDCTDSSGSAIQVHARENNVIRIQPKLDSFNSFITDKTRFSFDSLKNNRLKKVFFKEENVFNVVSYKTLFNKINSLLNEKKNILILIDDSIDLKSIFLLKQLQYKYDKLKFVCINDTFLFNFKNNKVSNISIACSKIIFVLGTNLKVENSLINLKIRNKYCQYNSKVFSSSFYKNTYLVQFINLQLHLITKIFEGKLKISQNILEYKNFVLIIGNSFKKRYNLYNSFFFFLKKFFPTLIIFDVLLNVYSEGLFFSNVQKLSKKLLKSANTIFSLNLEDKIIVRKILNRTSFFWFNTHGSPFIEKARVIIPTLLFLEEEQYFLDLNKNLKKTTKIINISNIKKTTLLLIDIFFSSFFKKNKFHFFSFIFEKKDIMNKKNIFFFDTEYKTLFYIKNYPFKFSFENYFCTNTYTKNSNFLLKRTQEIKNLYYFCE